MKDILILLSLCLLSDAAKWGYEDDAGNYENLMLTAQMPKVKVAISRVYAI